MSTLNTAFKQKSNTMFNNMMFNCAMIRSMHEQMERLYEAAERLRGVTGQSNLGRLLNESPQVIKNWEARGISERGIVNAQEIVGCDANWLRDGKGDMQRIGKSSTSKYDDISTLISLFGKMDETERQQLMTLARQLAKR